MTLANIFFTLCMMIAVAHFLGFHPWNSNLPIRKPMWYQILLGLQFVVVLVGYIALFYIALGAIYSILFT